MGSSFKSKLSRLPKLARPVVTTPAEVEPAVLASESTPGPAQERLQALKDRLDSMRNKHARQRLRRTAAQPLPGAVEETAFGPLHRYQQAYAADACHGHVPVSDCLQVMPTTLAELALDPVLEGVAIDKLLFIDTETTGLAGGAGTLPFLIGVAWFEDGCLQIEQLLLLRPGQEAPMLQHLAQRFASASALVTYNGKSFDWPLLRNRFVLNRVDMPVAVPHLDVLHCARRVFKHRQGPLRLTHLETTELGFTRVGDIEGALIPPTYFRFLRGASPNTLTPILTHNRHDLAALVALIPALAKRWASVEANTSGADCLALAQLSVRAGVKDRALDFAQAVAAQSDTSGVHAIEAQLLCAQLLRQRGDVDGALAALHAALQHPQKAEHAAVHLALAKLYEHHVKDFVAAVRHAQHTLGAEPHAAHQKRVERVRRKIG